MMRCISDAVCFTATIMIGIPFVIVMGGVMALLCVGVALPQMSGQIVGSFSVEITLWKVTTCSLVTGLCDESSVKDLCSTASTRLQAGGWCGIVAILTTFFGSGAAWVVLCCLRQRGRSSVGLGFSTGFLTGLVISILGSVFSLAALGLSASVYHTNFCGNSVNDVGFKEIFKVPGGSSTFGAGFIVLVIASVVLLLSNIAMVLCWVYLKHPEWRRSSGGSPHAGASPVTDKYHGTRSTDGGEFHAVA